MEKDKFTATWVSYTSIGSFLNCPYEYYLKNIYRDPKSGHKIKLMTPPLALGQAVHEVVESLSILPKDQRFTKSLIDKFEQVWQKVSGEKGGFISPDSEEKYKNRGKSMLKRVIDNPGPLNNLAVKIQKDLPYFWLSEKDNIILCGKIDWLEYLPKTDSVHIIDFKTGKGDEKPESLQIPIYHLLATHCQERAVTKASYWYLDRNSTLTEVPLTDLNQSRHKILEIAKQIKLARQLERFKCPHKDGCYACRPMEAIIQGKAEFVGVNEFKQDVYILNKQPSGKKNSVIL